MKIKKQLFKLPLCLGITLATIPIVLHITLVVIPISQGLSTEEINHTAITEWIGFSQHLKYPYIFYLALPFTCCLGINQLVIEKINSVFIKYAIIKQGINRFWLKSIALAFLDGFLIATLPLLIDLWATWTFLPSITSDWINNTMVVLPRLTFFHTLFYSTPYLLIIIYILMAGCLGGICSMLSIFVGLFTNKRFISTTASTVLCLLCAILATTWPKSFFDPTTVIIAYSPDYLPPFNLLVLSFFFTILIIWKLGTWRLHNVANS
ncbi:hypothetical protein [Levilactobacillus spicheri]|uniref:Uncharacterized protein n=2 Tax=Levilactobacillus spicheri TaxID=216463 RepID=A0A0F3RR13_9LACO|nr:hypothetical protein [Levilactobacillus spicheri]KJW12468.1 hypothetical protein VC81_08220 [Levilactobacillus spicheri]KRL48732.1 hypothetical protein FD37_GL001194 [Levilactobacillus spicheri DSM 15429]